MAVLVTLVGTIVDNALPSGAASANLTTFKLQAANAAGITNATFTVVTAASVTRPITNYRAEETGGVDWHFHRGLP
jgi:hypothetical protein